VLIGIAALGAANLAGCGGRSTGVSATELTQLRTEMAAARTATASANAPAVMTALRALQGEIASLRSRGALAPARARTLLIEIGQAQARVATDLPAAPQPAPAPSAPLGAAPPAAGAGTAPGPDAAKPHDKGKGKDHGKALGLDKQHGKSGGNGGD
jgi:hypothetical protein